VTRGASRPVHLRWDAVALVALGGAAGTAARVAITLAVPSMGAFPVATFAINVVGAFLLGMLLEVLARRGPDAGRLRRIRLLLGTGFLGGFTTYSALAIDTAKLTSSADTGTALAYSVGTILIGGVATWAGIVIGTRLAGRRMAR
jgi:fluoride exporter